MSTPNFVRTQKDLSAMLEGNRKKQYDYLNAGTIAEEAILEKKPSRDPYFSVLVPVYNVRAYLSDCIESVLSQSFDDFELILVDDGSTDESGAICDSFAAKDPRIRVFHKPNRGLLHTRRYGIEKSNGSHCVFLDSDDMLLQNALRTIRDTFESYHCDTVFYGWERLRDGKRIDCFIPAKTATRITDKRSIYMKCFCDHDYNSLCIKSVCTEVFHDFDYTSFYGLQRGEDLLQTVEILNNASDFVLIPHILYNYRQNDESITRKKPYDSNTRLRDYVTRFMQESGELTEQDLDQYYSHCAKGIVNNVIRASLSEKDEDELLSAFRRLGSSYTYEQISKRKRGNLSLGWRRVFFDLFRSGRYGLLRFLSWFYGLAARR